MDIKKYPVAKIEIIQPVYDHFHYTEGLSGVALYERISEWIWHGNKKGLSGGVIKHTEDVRDTLQDLPGVHFNDVGVIVTPNMTTEDDEY